MGMRITDDSAEMLGCAIGAAIRAMVWIFALGFFLLAFGVFEWSWWVAIIVFFLICFVWELIYPFVIIIVAGLINVCFPPKRNDHE